MEAPLLIDVVTIFPAMLSAILGESIMKRAADKGLVRFGIWNLREYTDDRHQTVDDRPFGGGPGMVLKPEPLFRAVEAVRTPGARVILMSPRGRRFDQALAGALAAERHLVVLCGHYEGVDQRVGDALATDEVSIGDYVLSSGTLAAAVMIDAVVRLVPGVLGAAESTAEESFRDGQLEYPQYTRPAEFRGMRVPEVLLSGDHGAIAQWRREQARRATAERRPDLVNQGEHHEGQDSGQD
jgi:tRNA (guanine37-N1)-methyltransferase